MTNHALKHGAAVNLAKLPEVCYTLIPGTTQVAVIQRGVKGYYATDWKHHDEKTVAKLNAEMGVTEAQRLAMVSGSMFGWHVPAADPATWEQKLLEQGKV